MIKQYVLLFLGIVLSSGAYAQQDPQYTMYMYNMNVVNPAYAGSGEDLNIGLLGREQWVGIGGAPSTYTANFHSAIGRGVGLGVSFIKDDIGPVSDTSGFIDISYMIPVSRKGKLSFGLKAGGSMFSVGRIDSDEQTSLNQGTSQFFPNIGAGIFYHTDVFYFGASSPNFIKAKHIDRDNKAKASEIEHYFLTSGYVFNASENLKVKPSTLFKLAAGAPVSIDLSLNAMFYERFELGVSHRLDDSWSGTFNFLATNKLRLGYAYDHTISELNGFNRGSHEFMILYRIPLTSRNIKSPRFF